MTKKRISLLIAVIIVALIVIKAKGLLSQRVAEISDTPLPLRQSTAVTLVHPVNGTLSRYRSFLAQIEARKSIALSTKLAGYIDSIDVKEAQKVRKGDRLLHIDDTELRSSIEALEVSLAQQTEELELARNIYERNKKLYGIGGLAKEQLDLSSIAVKAKQSIVSGTKSRIVQLQNQLEYLDIKAPFDGVVTQIDMRQGDLAVAGKSIVRLATEEKKLLFSYPAKGSDIAIGQKVLYDKKEIGRIVNLYPNASRDLAQAEIELSTDLQLPIQSHITVEIVTRQAHGCIIPNQSIVHKKDGNYLMIYQEKKFLPYKVDLLFGNERESLVRSCPNGLPIASGSETKLSELPSLGEVYIEGEADVPTAL